MAETERSNLPIAEEPEFTTEIPAIRPDDPVHYAQMNAMLESLLGNDVFLQRLANKMIENSLIAHVLDCENPQMVLGADQAPVITGLIDGVKEDVTQLYSDIQKLQNDLSALDTRVTNAINGGDLAAPYEIEMLYQPYTDSYPNLNVIEVTTSSATELQIYADSKWNSATNSYFGNIIRSYASTKIKIVGTKYKCIFTALVACYPSTGNKANNLRVRVRDASNGSVLLNSTPINPPSTGNPYMVAVTIPLSSLSGKTVYLEIIEDVESTTHSNRVGFKIQSLKVTNKD